MYIAFEVYKCYNIKNFIKLCKKWRKYGKKHTTMFRKYS